MLAITRVLEGRPRDLGGFSVRRVLPAGGQQTVGPFIFFDHMGPANFAPGEGVDVRPHPHIGLAERTPPELRRVPAGAPIHGIQTWIALPTAHEETSPSFSHHPAADLPEITGNGARLRLIAGEAYGARAPAAVFSPMFYVEAVLEAGATVELPDHHQERAAYVVEGGIEVAGDHYAVGQMTVFAAAVPVTLRAAGTARVMLLGGAPLDGPRYIWWNFVSSSRERIERAKLDWREERFAAVPGDPERIPLPET